MDELRKNYRPWDAQQNCQEVVSPRDALPEDDLVFFLIDTVATLDLSAFHQHYARELRGLVFPKKNGVEVKGGSGCTSVHTLPEIRTPGRNEGGHGCKTSRCTRKCSP